MHGSGVNSQPRPEGLIHRTTKAPCMRHASLSHHHRVWYGAGRQMPTGSSYRGGPGVGLWVASGPGVSEAQSTAGALYDETLHAPESVHPQSRPPRGVLAAPRGVAVGTVRYPLLPGTTRPSHSTQKRGCSIRYSSLINWRLAMISRTAHVQRWSPSPCWRRWL